jgi:hypothetical protein
MQTQPGMHIKAGEFGYGQGPGSYIMVTEKYIGTTTLCCMLAGFWFMCMCPLDSRDRQIWVVGQPGPGQPQQPGGQTAPWAMQMHHQSMHQQHMQMHQQPMEMHQQPMQVHQEQQQPSSQYASHAPGQIWEDDNHAIGQIREDDNYGDPDDDYDGDDYSDEDEGKELKGPRPHGGGARKGHDPHFLIRGFTFYDNLIVIPDYTL